MPGLFPEIAPVTPDPTPYTGKLVYLSFSPMIRDGKTLDACASIKTLPYRVLADGTIDVAPESMAVHLNVGSIAEAAAKDAKLAAAVTAISQAIKSYMAG